MPDWLRDLLVPVFGFLGVAVGAAAAYWSNYRLWRKRLEQEERQVARALRGEIGALLQLLNKRNYPHYFRRIASQSKQLGRVVPASVSVQQNFFQVFDANVQKLGLLTNPVPERVVELYVLAKGIVEDFATISQTKPEDLEAMALRLGVSPPFTAAAVAPGWAESLSNTADLIDEWVRQGDQVVQVIDEHYPPRAG